MYVVVTIGTGIHLFILGVYSSGSRAFAFRIDIFYSTHNSSRASNIPRTSTKYIPAAGRIDSLYIIFHCP